MREIKFRGRSSKDNKTWFTGSLVSLTDIDEAYIDHYDGLRRVIECYPVDTATVGQFTGHYDVTGKEMYEGDIISGYFEEDEWPAVVEWDEDTASFVLCGQCSAIRFDDIGGLEVMIVGNVHDNPELQEAAHAQSD